MAKRAKKPIRVDFFQVCVPADARESFEDLMRASMARSNAGRREWKVGDDFVRIEDLEEGTESETVEGCLSKIRIALLPDIGKVRGTSRPMELDDDEGPCERSFFLFHRPTNVIIISRDQYGPHWTKICGYFERFQSERSPITFEPLLKNDSFARLRNLTEVRKFEIGFALPQGKLPIPNTDSMGTLEFANLASNAEAATAYFSISIGRRRGSLKRNLISQLLSPFFGSRATSELDVTRCRITGNDDEANASLIDFIEDRIAESASVSVEGRRIPNESYRAALRSTWRKKCKEIESAYRPSRS